MVEPSSGDAVVGLMGGHMVDAVVLAGQDDVPVLQHGDVPGQAKVGVGPLVTLQTQAPHAAVLNAVLETCTQEAPDGLLSP